MKYIASTILVWTVTCICAVAQPVLTADSFFDPRFTQQLSASTFSADNPEVLAGIVGKSGANQTYDFTPAFYGEPITYGFQYLAPPFDDIPGAGNAAFANANIAYKLVTEAGDAWFFDNLSDEGLYSYGIVIQSDFDGDGEDDMSTTSWNPARLEFPFPLTFGTSWTSASTQIAEVEGIPIVTEVQQEEVNIIDGWGTLVVPEGSFECLRLKKDITQSMAGVVLSQTTLYEFITPLFAADGKTEGTSLVFTATISTNASGILDAGYSQTIIGAEATASEDGGALPDRFRLEPNYPNPFNPSTTIPFSLDESGHVSVEVVDVLGHPVASLLNREMAAGTHRVSWNPAGHLPSGLYQIRLTVNGKSVVRAVAYQK